MELEAYNLLSEWRLLAQIFKSSWVSIDLIKMGTRLVPHIVSARLWSASKNSSERHLFLICSTFSSIYSQNFDTKTTIPTNRIKHSSQVTEEDLNYTIKHAQIEDSLQVFRLLGGADGVSEELKIKFLQLLCFYNEKEADSMEWLEERWFAANSRDRHVATWRLVLWLRMWSLFDNSLCAPSANCKRFFMQIRRPCREYIQLHGAKITRSLLCYHSGNGKILPGK